MLLSVKELLDSVTKLRKCSGVMEPQPMWYLATGREDSTPEVLELLDLFGEKENPHDYKIWKTCSGFKNPLEFHRNVEIAIRETPNSSGLSIRGNMWLSDDISAPKKSKGKNLVFSSRELAKPKFPK
jgi:hypothetical protein